MNCNIRSSRVVGHLNNVPGHIVGFWQPSCKVSGYWLCLLECIVFRDNCSFQDTLALLATLNIRLVAVAFLSDPYTSEPGWGCSNKHKSKCFAGGTRPQLAIDSASKQWLPNGLQEWTCTKDTSSMIGSHLNWHPGYSLSWALMMEGPDASLLLVWYSFLLLGFHRPEDDINPESDTKMGNQPARSVLFSHPGSVKVNV
jgi:hypothetical protein